MTQPNYDVSELRLLVNPSGWVLGSSRLGVSTRLVPDAEEDTITISDISSLSLTWETSREDTFYLLPSISRMVVNTPAPQARSLPSRANVTLTYRDEQIWSGLLRTAVSRTVKRHGRSTIWVTTLAVEGPEQPFESKTATLEASETFDGVSVIMEQAGVSFTRVGNSDASARCLAAHLPPHDQISQSKLAMIRMFAKQTGSGLVGYNYHTGGWELRHAEDAITVSSALLQASDGEMQRAVETGRLHFMPSRGAEEEDPPDYVVFPVTDPDPVGQTAGYSAFMGLEQTEVSLLTTTYTFPNHMALLPVVNPHQNEVTELLVPFTEDWFEDGILYAPLPWRGSVDFEDGDGEQDVTILSVTHEISPTGWLMRMQTARGSLLDRFPCEDASTLVPGAIVDLTATGGSGEVEVGWDTTARGFVQHIKVMVGIHAGSYGALNPVWAARDVSMGGMTDFAIVNRTAGSHTFTGLPPGVYTVQVWHVTPASVLHGTNTVVPGVGYTIGGHSRTRTVTVS